MHKLNFSKIFAFDRNAQRLNLLRKMSKNANARIIQAQCIDFLQVDVNKFTQVFLIYFYLIISI